MKTKNFLEYIKENRYPSPSNGFSPTAAWGLSPLDSVSSGSNVPYDDELIANPWGRHVNDTKFGINKGAAIMSTLYNTSVFGNKPDNITEIAEDITEISIINIEKNKKFLIDIYLRFYYQEDVQYMTITDVGGLDKLKFKSTLYRYNALRDFKVREKVQGLFMKMLKKWFIPQVNFRYQTENKVTVYSAISEQKVLPPKTEVTVKKIIYNTVSTDIEIVIDGFPYYIRNNDSYFFRWNFSPVEKKYFYL